MGFISLVFYSGNIVRGRPYVGLPFLEMDKQGQVHKWVYGQIDNVKMDECVT